VTEKAIDGTLSGGRLEAGVRSSDGPVVHVAWVVPRPRRPHPSRRSLLLSIGRTAAAAADVVSAAAAAAAAAAVAAAATARLGIGVCPVTAKAVDGTLCGGGLEVGVCPVTAKAIVGTLRGGRLGVSVGSGGPVIVHGSDGPVVHVA
jgi:hypothetical protein